MGDIVCCLVGMPDAKLRKKIAETLRIHQIQITDDIKHATCIIHIPDEAPQMSIEEIASALVAQTQAEVFELKKQLDMSNIALDISNIPVVLPAPVIQPNKRKNFDVKHALRQYNRTKQGHNRNLFNRIKHK